MLYCEREIPCYEKNKNSESQFTWSIQNLKAHLQVKNEQTNSIDEPS